MANLPEQLWRFPTREAIDSLAQRFSLENRPDMQDWEWEVADPARAEEFVTAYKTAALTDDERFTLMEMILQSFEERAQVLAGDLVWLDVLHLIEQNVDLHISSVWHWACEQSGIGDAWRVTPFMREILARHISRFLATHGRR
jgi:hypothetical protein